MLDERDLSLLKAQIDEDFIEFINAMVEGREGVLELTQHNEVMSLVYSAFMNAYLTAKNIKPVEVSTLFKNLDKEIYGGSDAITTH